jgi:cell division protein FtsB
LRAHWLSTSQIFGTLEVTRLSGEDLGRLCALEQLNWGVLSESVRRCLIGLRQELSGAQQQKGELEIKVREQAREIENLHKEVVQAETEKVAMKAAVDEQRRRIGELEGESQTQKGTIVRQTSEIEGLTTAKKKCENELERSTGAAEAQVREIEQLKAKEDQVMKEVEKLKEEIRRMAAEYDSLLKERAEAKDLPNKSPLPPTPPKPFQPLEKDTVVVELVHKVFPGQQIKQEFPPSVKKGGQFDIPDGIIAHVSN